MKRLSNYTEIKLYSCVLKSGFNFKTLSRTDLSASVVKTKLSHEDLVFLVLLKKKNPIWHKLIQKLAVFFINLENKGVPEVRNSLKFCKVSINIRLRLPLFSKLMKKTASF